MDPRGTLQQTVGLPRRSEDRLDTPRVCVRAPGPCRRRHRHLHAPKDVSAKEANTSRPLNLSTGFRTPPQNPEGLLVGPKSPLRGPGAHQRRPLAAPYRSEERQAKLEPSSELRGRLSTKRRATLWLRRAIGRSVAPRARARDDRLIASVSPRDPEGSFDEASATPWPP